MARVLTSPKVNQLNIDQEQFCLELASRMKLCTSNMAQGTMGYKMGGKNEA